MGSFCHPWEMRQGIGGVFCVVGSFEAGLHLLTLNRVSSSEIIAGAIQLLFNSYEDLLVFLPVTAVIYLALGRLDRIAASKVWLVFASLVFYSWWGLHYLPLIVTSILVNYAIGTALGRGEVLPSLRRALLIAGLGFNLGLLGYFKYANFFVENLNNVAGINVDFAHVALPLAISFFTFQKIAYLVDSFRGQTVDYNFLDYALFVTFFPQLIAGTHCPSQGCGPAIP